MDGSYDKYYFAKIVALGVLVAVGYGVCQDQITIRICPEYFTVWHPNPLDLTNLSELALYWGIVATWWVGLILGCLVAGAATIGPYPVLSVRSVARKLVWLAFSTGIAATLSGVVVEDFGPVRFPDFARFFISGLGTQEQYRFVIDYAAHTVAYAFSAMGAIVVAIVILMQRSRLSGSKRHAEVLS